MRTLIAALALTFAVPALADTPAKTTSSVKAPAKKVTKKKTAAKKATAKTSTKATAPKTEEAPKPDATK